MELRCIGFKITFTGDRMWYYKLDYDNKEYSIVDAGFLLLDMLWKDNSFVNTNFDKNRITEIKKLISETEKVEVLLGEDGERDYFTKCEIKKSKSKKCKVRKDNIYSADEITKIFNIFDDFGLNSKNIFYEVTQEMCDCGDREYGSPDLLKDLVGFKFKVSSKGEHKNDGQLVSYKFTFISPKGVKTDIWTDMCLMVGWNHCYDEKIG